VAQEEKRVNVIDFAQGDDWVLYQGDCAEVIRALPAESVGLSVFSPPFSNLYCYSDSDRDMGNSVDDAQFLAHYGFLAAELLRVTMPGRLCAVHCKDLVDYAGSSGRAGLRDFPGDLIRVHEAAGWKYHSRVTVWKCPVREMQRTKAHGLLYKQLRRDSTFSRQGLAEYVLVFRRWAAEGDEVEPVEHTEDTFPLARWQEWASPVWMDIQQTNVLNVELAREDGDEKHMCLARGSLVLTYDGYRPIDKVAVGDLVLTHRGRWRPVKAKERMGVRDTIRVAAQGVADLRVTPEHPLWVREGRTAHPRRIARQAQPEWMPAERTLGSYVGLPLPPVEDSDLTNKEWWIIGRWLGDGHTDTRGRIHISCAHDELEGLLEALGATAGHVSATATCSQVALKDRGGRLRSITNRCGTGASKKTVTGEALSLDVSKSESLLAGYLSADGHYVAECDRWSASSVSRALVLGMALVAQRARGVVASVYPGRKASQTTIEGRVVSTKDDWILSIPPRNASAMLLDDGAWKKVRSLEDLGTYEVWDLQVDEDESFVAEGCAVHNCPLQLDLIERCIALWSNPGDVVLSPFAGIGSEGVVARRLGRRFVGVELKRSYWERAARNLDEAVRQPDLFAGVE
jgi:hypothetical protein